MRKKLKGSEKKLKSAVLTENQSAGTASESVSGGGQILICVAGRGYYQEWGNADIIDGLLDVTENRYSGIPTIRAECRDAGLPAPIFSVRHGKFTVIFKNSIYQAVEQIQRGNMTDDLLRFCTVPRNRTELTDFTGMSRYYTMNAIVQPLVETGKLQLTLPEKPKSSKQRYVAK